LHDELGWRHIRVVWSASSVLRPALIGRLESVSVPVDDYKETSGAWNCAKVILATHRARAMGRRRTRTQRRTARLSDSHGHACPPRQREADGHGGPKDRPAEAAYGSALGAETCTQITHGLLEDAD